MNVVLVLLLVAVSLGGLVLVYLRKGFGGAFGKAPATTVAAAPPGVGPVLRAGRSGGRRAR